MRKAKLLLIFAFMVPCLARVQGVPYSDIVLAASRRPIGGAGVSVCNSPGLATTAASVSSNLATLTFASNPITAGFAAGMTLSVSGFTGADTYLNGGTLSGGIITGGFTILSVTSTTIVYQFSHANATATSNGFAFQQGNVSTPCAPLAAITSDPAGVQPIAQPGFASDGLGNYAFYAASGPYKRFSLAGHSILEREEGVYVAHGLVDGIPDGDVRCSRVLPLSLSLRAARVVAANRIAYFRCSSI